LFVVQFQQESLRLDVEIPYKASIMKPLVSQVNSPSEINSFFSFEYYIKGKNFTNIIKQLYKS